MPDVPTISRALHHVIHANQLPYSPVSRLSLFGPLCTYLAGGEVVVQSHGVGSVHEHLRHGGQILDGLEFQSQQVPIDGLTVDGLETHRQAHEWQPYSGMFHSSVCQASTAPGILCS